MNKLSFRDFLTWDLYLSLLVAVICYFVLDFLLTGAFVQDVYQLGITILSIVFSVFFAAMAIIISTSDNDFVSFLEAEDKSYTLLISILKASVMIIFVALMYSVFMFLFTSYQLNHDPAYHQYKYFTVFFIFMFSYSMLSSLGSLLMALTYAVKRVSHLQIMELRKKENIE